MIAVMLFSTALMVEPAAPGGTAPAAAPPSPAGVTAAAPTKTAKADPERVCRLEAVLGSKITKKVCFNRTQMEERTFYDKQNLDLIQAATPGPRQ
jgi:hypothetical protein